jgi:hypothetical protein
MLSSGSRISSVAHQLSCFGVGFSLCLITGACFFASPPFSGARSVIRQPAPCCQLAVMVFWLFFNFAVLFDFGCCSLAQEMSFVNHYLPYFRRQLITAPPPHWQPSCLFNCLFTEVHTEVSSLLFPLLQCTFRVPAPSAMANFQFVVYSVFFFAGGVNMPRGLCWFIEGVGDWGNTM